MRRLYLLAVCLPAVSSCGNQPGPIQVGTSPDGESELKRQLIRLENKVEELQAKVDKSSPDTTVMLIPSEKGFGFMPTDMGRFPVSIESVQPYADGTRVRLKIGNPTAAYIMKMSVTAEWGTASENGSYKSAGSKKVEFENLLRGKWNEKTLDIPALKPNSFGYVTLTTDSVDTVSFVGF